MSFTKELNINNPVFFVSSNNQVKKKKKKKQHNLVETKTGFIDCIL